MDQSFYIVSIDWTAHAVHFLAMDGVLYRGAIKVNALERHSYEHDTDGFIQSRNKRTDINTYAKIEVHTSRVPKIDRVCDIAVCDFAKSYVVLQENSKQYMKLPELSDEAISLKELLDETTEMDALHDIVFHVGAKCNNNKNERKKIRMND